MKIRQVTDPIIDLSIEDFEVKFNEIKIWREFDLNEKIVDIAILINDFNEDDSRYKALAHLYLDHTLSELNVLTKVRYIDFGSWDSLSSEAEFISLIDLKKEIENTL